MSDIGAYTFHEYVCLTKIFFDVSDLYPQAAGIFLIEVSTPLRSMLIVLIKGMTSGFMQFRLNCNDPLTTGMVLLVILSWLLSPLK